MILQHTFDIQRGNLNAAEPYLTEFFRTSPDNECQQAEQNGLWINPSSGGQGWLSLNDIPNSMNIFKPLWDTLNGIGCAQMDACSVLRYLPGFGPSRPIGSNPCVPTTAFLACGFELEADQTLFNEDTRPFKQEKLDAFRHAALGWALSMWGKRLCMIAMHADGKYPHIHFLVVPANLNQLSRNRFLQEAEKKDWNGTLNKTMAELQTDSGQPEAVAPKASAPASVPQDDMLDVDKMSFDGADFTGVFAEPPTSMSTASPAANGETVTPESADTPASAMKDEALKQESSPIDEFDVPEPTKANEEMTEPERKASKSEKPLFNDDFLNPEEEQKTQRGDSLEGDDIDADATSIDVGYRLEHSDTPVPPLSLDEEMTDIFWNSGSCADMSKEAPAEDGFLSFGSAEEDAEAPCDTGSPVEQDAKLFWRPLPGLAAGDAGILAGPPAELEVLALQLAVSAAVGRELVPNSHANSMPSSTRRGVRVLWLARTGEKRLIERRRLALASCLDGKERQLLKDNMAVEEMSKRMSAAVNLSMHGDFDLAIVSGLFTAPRWKPDALADEMALELERAATKADGAVLALRPEPLLGCGLLRHPAMPKAFLWQAALVPQKKLRALICKAFRKPMDAPVWQLRFLACGDIALPAPVNFCRTEDGTFSIAE